VKKRKVFVQTLIILGGLLVGVFLVYDAAMPKVDADLPASTLMSRVGEAVVDKIVDVFRRFINPS
jgi:hypothetical protein